MVRHALSEGKSMHYIIGALLAVVTLSACGSGSSVTLPQQKKATLVFALNTSASLPTAVRTIEISARIPAGVTVPLESGKQVAGTVLTTSKAGSIIFGRYSAPLLRIQVADTTFSGTGLGLDNVREFASIILPVQESVTEGSFTALNPPPLVFRAEGHITDNTVDLSQYLKASMKVTF